MSDQKAGKDGNCTVCGCLFSDSELEGSVKHVCPEGFREAMPAWVKHEWDPENPACVRCGATMFLLDGCEWEDDPAMNLCHSCALEVIREQRKT